MSTSDPWRDRIVDSGSVPPKNLIPHPKNWRRHPPAQRQALEAVLDRIGSVSRILVNKRTGRLLDGHLRVELAIARKMKTVPVDYVDLSEDEELTVLASKDAIAAIAAPDMRAYTELVESIGDDSGLRALLAEVGADLEGLYKRFSVEAVEVSFVEQRTAPEFHIMRLSVHTSQRDMILGAIARATELGLAVSTVNDNEIGNAVSAIVREWLAMKARA